jgi:hypothetical protein
VEDDVPVVSPAEKADIEAALESYRQGCVVDVKRTRGDSEILTQLLGVEGYLY